MSVLEVWRVMMWMTEGEGGRVGGRLESVTIMRGFVSLFGQIGSDKMILKGLVRTATTRES